jgi:general secretion pathway protein E
MTSSIDQSIAEWLLAAGKIQPEQVTRAQRASAGTDTQLGQVLLKLGFISEADLAAVTADVHQLPLAQPAWYATVPVLTQQVSQAFLLRHTVVPVQDAAGAVWLAMVDPSQQTVLDALSLALEQSLSPCIGTASEIQAALQQTEVAVSEPVLIQAATDAEDIAQLQDLAGEAPVVQAVNRLWTQAIEAGASDIHLEPMADQLQVRLRVDGVLRPVTLPSGIPATAVISRIKVLARLNIAERRLPQDGRLQLRIAGHTLDLRISTVPTAHGESVVLRLLDQAQVPLDFASLGFDGQNLRHLQTLLQRAHGMILVSGPTGSGKTTTLYAALQQLNTPEQKILTVEDPIEYQLAGINQIQVQPQIELSFARALRAILRQDPDILMIGEMRDVETAQIAVQAALTGHLVLSTVHTNDAISSIVRLLDMQLAPFLLSATIAGVVAQRLVRTLCPACRVPHPHPESILSELDGAKTNILQAVGCAECGFSGYQGRTTISEVLLLNDDLRHLIAAQADLATLRQAASQAGLCDLWTDGLRKVGQGITTLEEIQRVCA